VMQYKKLTNEQKQIRSERLREAKKIGKLMADNPHLTAREARDFLSRKNAKPFDTSGTDENIDGTACS
jgi:hypothetical protein